MRLKPPTLSKRNFLTNVNRNVLRGGEVGPVREENPPGLNCPLAPSSQLPLPTASPRQEMAGSHTPPPSGRGEGGRGDRGNPSGTRAVPSALPHLLGHSLCLKWSCLATAPGGVGVQFKPSFPCPPRSLAPRSRLGLRCSLAPRGGERGGGQGILPFKRRAGSPAFRRSRGWGVGVWATGSARVYMPGPSQRSCRRYQEPGAAGLGASPPLPAWLPRPSPTPEPGASLRPRHCEGRGKELGTEKNSSRVTRSRGGRERRQSLPRSTQGQWRR